MAAHPRNRTSAESARGGPRARTRQGPPRTPAARRGPGRPPGATGDETRRQVLAAALESFAREGLRGTSMREIASAARIRVSTLYHYFPSKEALYAEVQRQVQDQMREMIVGVLSRDLEFADSVRECIGQHFDFFLANPAYVRLNLRACIDEDAARASDQRAADRWLGFTEGALRPAQARGLAKRVDPVLLMMTMEALLHWFVANQELYRHLTGRGFDDPAAAREAREHIIDVAIATLGAGAERAGG